MRRIAVTLAICPKCGKHIEWQGNDYGYLCNGRPDARHDDTHAVVTAGSFTYPITADLIDTYA